MKAKPLPLIKKEGALQSKMILIDNKTYFSINIFITAWNEPALN